MNDFPRNNTIIKECREDYTISTVKVIFMNWYGNYETAIKLNDLGKWKVIRGYDTEEEAIKGHKEIMAMDFKQFEKLEQMEEVK